MTRFIVWTFLALPIEKKDPRLQGWDKNSVFKCLRMVFSASDLQVIFSNNVHELNCIRWVTRPVIRKLSSVFWKEGSCPFVHRYLWPSAPAQKKRTHRVPSFIIWKHINKSQKYLESRYPLSDFYADKCIAQLQVTQLQIIISCTYNFWVLWLYSVIMYKDRYICFSDDFSELFCKYKARAEPGLHKIELWLNGAFLLCEGTY